MIPSKLVTTLHAGDRVVFETAGGGGYGDPARRTGEQLRADLADGKISREGAASYGVTASLRRLEVIMSRQTVIRSLQDYYDDGRFLADLRRRVAIPTESQNPSRRPELYQYLEAEIAPALRALDYAVTIYDNPDPAGGPFLIGRRIEDPDALTVLTYGHGDVVRGLDKDWRSGLSPWTITLDGDRIYGRGVVDNKGQHTINIAALAEVIAARGRLGFNSIFFVEMSEEVGSPGIHAFAQAQRAALAADLLIGSDGPRVTIDRPTIYLGSRGAMNLELSLNLREGGHHSGNWGGLLANPGIILAHAIASIVSKTGEILVPELRPKQLPPSIRKALEGIDDRRRRRRPGDRSMVGGAGAERGRKGFRVEHLRSVGLHHRQS